MRIAFVFPGQTSHRPGVLTSWQTHPAGAAVLDEVVFGAGPGLALADDPAAAGQTAVAQPAALTASLLAWRALVDGGVQPDIVAGHSLGEVTAAVAAGVLSVRDGAALAAVRGEAMAAVGARVGGGMAVVLRLGRDAVEVIVDGIDGAEIANDDAPGRIVVAGTPPALRRLREVVRFAGGRAVPLAAEGAFHSPAIAEVAPALVATLGRLRLRDPRVPIVTGASPRPLRTASGVASALVAGPSAPVRWREVQDRLAALGVRELVEVGPGGLLADLASRALPQVRVHTVATPDDLEPVLGALAPLRVAV